MTKHSATASVLSHSQLIITTKDHLEFASLALTGVLLRRLCTMELLGTKRINETAHLRRKCVDNLIRNIERGRQQQREHEEKQGEGIMKNMEQHLGRAGKTWYKRFVEERMEEYKSGRENKKQDFLDVLLENGGDGKDKISVTASSYLYW
ncbi:putative cytochrome P450 [Tripterygium wilfordii]|uniref:Putative cytochrome P450 n=1 Tax=Tripterygium wilfordii TaxID=458696 RepID=A0A7J7BT09_TRIWF|nr:putative cytochrome P450 [Tripterygium wilfordii]